jgi:hypothetical protein
MQKFYHNIGFLEKRQFFRRKLSKIAEIVIITSTPGCHDHRKTILAHPIFPATALLHVSRLSSLYVRAFFWNKVAG